MDSTKEGAYPDKFSEPMTLTTRAGKALLDGWRRRGPGYMSDSGLSDTILAIEAKARAEGAAALAARIRALPIIEFGDGGDGYLLADIRAILAATDEERPR